MKKNQSTLLILFIWMLSGCQVSTISPSNEPTSQPIVSWTNTEITSPTFTLTTAITPTPAVLPSETASPTISSTSIPTSSPAPTPEIQIDLSRFDFDIAPPIEIFHNAPLITQLEETVDLEFGFLCAYLLDTPGLSCKLTGTLFVTYGNGNDFMPVPLSPGYREGTQFLSASIPANDANGQPLRYYIEINDHQVGLTIRFPTSGSLDLFVAPEFIPVELLAEPSSQPSELALAVPWGDGQASVGQRMREGYPYREGPFALDVAEDGRIALLDPVHERVLVYHPYDQTFSQVPLPFPFTSQGDMVFDSQGRLAIFDSLGMPLEQSTISIPQLYVMAMDGSVSTVAPVYVYTPAGLNRDLEVFDIYDGRWVTPFAATGEVQSRAAQQIRRNPDLLYRFAGDQALDVAHFADVETGLAFELHSASPLGAMIDFERTLRGYVVVFYGDQIRAVWFDSDGSVLQDVALPNHQYTEVYYLGQVVIDVNGGLYVLDSLETAIEVWYVPMP